LLEELARHPVVAIAGAVRPLETTKPTAARTIAILEEVGVLIRLRPATRPRALDGEGEGSATERGLLRMLHLLHLSQAARRIPA